MEFVRAVMCFCFAVLLSASATARPLDEVRHSGELRIFVYSDNKPWSWEENGKKTGIDVDIGREIAASMDVKAEIYMRPAGEEVDDDLRGHIWQGPRIGGNRADIMMHVPMERELIARNNLVGISNAYYQEQIVLAINTKKLGKDAELAAFETNKVAVKFSTSGHYFLAFARDGKIRDNVAPYMKFESAAEEFLAGNVAGLMGRRAEIETVLAGKDVEFRIVAPTFPKALRQNWNVGTAVKEDSRDVGYAAGAAFDAMRADGRLEKIFAKYGVTATPPKTR